MNSPAIDSTTHLMLTRSEAHERRAHAEAHARAIRVARLRRFDRRAERAVVRARRARAAVA
jgi:hypothetical protein